MPASPLSARTLSPCGWAGQASVTCGTLHGEPVAPTRQSSAMQIHILVPGARPQLCVLAVPLQSTALVHRGAIGAQLLSDKL